MTAYEKICAEACGGCRDRHKFAVIIGKIGNPKVHESDPDGMGAHYEPCKAPPRDEVIEWLTAELPALKQSLKRFANPWTVEVRHRSGHWESLCHDAPIALSEAERRVEELRSENPDAIFRAVPYLNLSQAEHVRAELAALKLERDELRADKERLAHALKVIADELNNESFRCSEGGLRAVIDVALAAGQDSGTVANPSKHGNEKTTTFSAPCHIEP